MSTGQNPRSTAEMMSDIAGHVGNLVRGEADLARAEMTESLNKVKASVAGMALALALGIVGLNLLAAALVAFAIKAGLPPQWAPVAVGVVLLLIAWAIYSSAKSALHRIGFVPTRSAQNLKRDAAAIKDTFNDA